MDKVSTYQNKYKELLPQLNERARRLIAAADAKALGHGGVKIIHNASGISKKTIIKGKKELTAGSHLPENRSRRKGGGRKKVTDKDKTIQEDLRKLVSDSTRGDPESPLRWTCKSTRVLAEVLKEQGHKITHPTVASLLKADNYSLQANVKVKEGSNHPDRDEQFRYINKLSKEYIEAGNPVISVDSKKKELVGNYKNNGKTWLPKGRPIEVNVHDFPDKKKGKAVPYGIYDISENQGYVNVGIDHNTAEFAAESIRRWWKYLGRERYANSKNLMITADAGGSNGYRLRLWKKELQKIADEIGMDITVCHFPPGTSKWNKIEHRLFSFISINWKGKPLTDYKVIIDSIASTNTKKGLKVYAVLDENKYELRKKVSDMEMAALQIFSHEFHGEWNYSVKSRKK